MERAGQQIGRIEIRLRQLGLRLDRLVAKADEAGPEATSDYRQQIDRIREKHAVARGKMKAFRDANGEKWENFKGGVEIACHDLENAFKAVSQ